MEPVVFETGPGLDAALEAVPNRPAIFLISTDNGQPYLARTGMLRRRLKRLLGERSTTSRFLHLRGLATRVEYWLTGSRLSSSLRFYELARRYFPDGYEKLVKFRWPTYVKLLLNNDFPRTTLTTRLSASGGPAYGPFATRSIAEEFEQGLLDLFQVRRCPEDLVPAPNHPGCIYGEMGKCLRPCQEIVGADEYHSEVARVRDFLATNGESLIHTITTARDRFSEELMFEEAARQQARLAKVEQLLRLRSDLAVKAESVCGLAVLPSPEPDSVELCFLVGGGWGEPTVFALQSSGAEMIPLDRRLRELAAMQEVKVTVRQRQEHLALLVRWVFSSWRDGEWLPFESLEKLPYRKAVNAIARVVKGSQQPLP